MKPPQMILSLFGLLPLLPIGIAEVQWVQLASASDLGSSSAAQIIPIAPLQFVPPAAPRRGRPPGRRQGGASRGSCEIANRPPLTALVPFAEPDASAGTGSATEATDEKTTNLKEQSLGSQSSDVFSLTTQARPSFWFYVPYSLETTPLEFVLQDEDNNTLYQSGPFTGILAEDATEGVTRSTANSSDHGIIQVTLPESAPALEPTNIYHWFFLAYCEEADHSFVEGWIARSPLPSASSEALAAATPREQAIFYAQNGIWQETLTVLGEQYKENAADATVSRDWEGLLESANLGHLSEQPLVDCCSLE